jgi:hypothetical protein
MATIIISGIIWFLSVIRDENFYNKIENTNNNYVLNHTKYQYMDTVIYAGLAELGVSDKVIVIQPLSGHPLLSTNNNDNELVLEAAIIGNGTQFVIYVSNMNRDKAIRVLSHELIHLKQYSDGRLAVTDSAIVWNGASLPFDAIREIRYIDRPWEMEAFGYGAILNEKVKYALYE